MAVSIFDDKFRKPEEVELPIVLGQVQQLWYDLKSYLSNRFSPVNEEWKFYSKQSGWSLVLKHAGRTILYLLPNKEYFKAYLVYSERAVAMAGNGSIPPNILAIIHEARPYAEGRGFMVEVKTEEDLKIVKELAEIKMKS